MSWKSAFKHLGIAGILIASLCLGIATPAFAADMVILNPTSATITEGETQAIDVSLPEPIISGDPGAYALISFTSSNSSRLSLSSNGIYFEDSYWSTHQTINLQANEDPFANEDVVVTVSYSIESNSEYYNNASGSMQVTVQNNDTEPAVAITYPEPNKTLPAGSLMITGTATAKREIVVKIDGKIAGTTQSDESGNWHLLVEKISAGKHSFVAQVQTSDHYAFLANAYTRSIDVVNMDTHEYVYEITEANSVGATFNTVDNTVYSAADFDGDCFVIAYDPLTYQEKFRIGDESNPEGCSAQSMTLSPDGRKAYLLFHSTDISEYSVRVLNLITQEYESSTVMYELEGNYPSGISITPDGEEIWVRVASGIERYATDGYIYLGNIELSEDPTAYRQNIVFNKTGTIAYTSDDGLGVVHVIDPNTHQVTDTITVADGVNMVALSPDETKLFIAAAYPTSAIFTASTATNQLIDTETVAPELPPESIAINSDGQWVVGDDHGSGAIFFGNVANNATVANTIYAPRGGSYYTSVSDFASPTLLNVLGVSTTIEADAVNMLAPNTGYRPK